MALGFRGDDGGRGSLQVGEDMWGCGEAHYEDIRIVIYTSLSDNKDKGREGERKTWASRKLKGN